MTWLLLLPFLTLGDVESRPRNIVGSAASQAEVSPQAAPPNVLIVLADDLGVDMLRRYGVDTLSTDLPLTPVLDGLADRGVLFENAWAQPLCSPTRASILTGRYGFRTGVTAAIERGSHSLPATELTLPKALALAPATTWRTGAFGKWHLERSGSPEICSATRIHGFDYFEGANLVQPVTEYCGNYFDIQCAGPLLTYQLVPQGRPMFDEAFDNARDWIAVQQDPWLCYLAPQVPYEFFHTPNPALLNTSLPSNPTACSTSCGSCGLDCNGAPACRTCYVAAIEAMDTLLGDLLSSIGPRWWMTTTVIFVGDNGTPNDSNSFWPCKTAKGNLENGGIRVPLLVAGRGVAPAMRGARTPALVNTVDLFPTVLELARLDPSALGVTLDGVSLNPVLLGRQGGVRAVRDWVFAEKRAPNGPSAPSPPYGPGEFNQRTVRDELYKVIRSCDPAVADRVYAVSDLHETLDLYPTLPMGTAPPDLLMSYVALDAILSGLPGC